MYNYNEVLDATLKYFNNDELATNVWMSKYALKNGDKYLELTPLDMHKRMSIEFAKIEAKYDRQLTSNEFKSLSMYGQIREDLTEEKIFNYFDEFKNIIPQGSVMSSLGDAKSFSSLSNCVVLPKIYDSYGGIMYTDQQLTHLYKRRFGAGINLSTLRPEGDCVKNSAKTTSGATSFMERFSNTTREVGQNNRRGALMETMDCRHPDILKFINMKRDKTKVTGANVSVMWTSDFLEAVEKDDIYILRFPVDVPIEDASVTKEVKAKEIWDAMILANWEGGEPGFILKDQLEYYTTCHNYEGFKVIGLNPCISALSKVIVFNIDSEQISLQTFDKIKESDIIWSQEGWTNVIKKWSNGIKPVYKYKTTAGSFIGTEDHKILQKGIKIKVADADKLDLLRGVEHVVQDDNIQAVVDGLVLGDGTIRDKHPILLIGKKDLDYFKSEVVKHINTPYPASGNRYNVNTTITKNELPHTYLRVIPERYMSSNHDSVCGLLRGLYSANGSVVASRVTLKSTSFELIEQLQILLSFIGIRSYHTTNKAHIVKHRNGNYRSKESYDLNISTDRDIFLNKVGFIQKYKVEKLEKSLHNKNLNKKLKSHNITSVEYLGDFEVFDITVDNNAHTFWCDGINVSNCAEIGMSNDSCRLIAINMFNCVVYPFTRKAYFDYNKWYKVVYESQRLMDDLVDLELEALLRIIDKVKNDPEPEYIKDIELRTLQGLYESGKQGRRTGLGITALGDTLASLNIKYDSDYGIKTIDGIMKLKMLAEFDSSIDMSIERGSFPAFGRNIEKTHGFWLELKDEFPNLYERNVKYGRRNISISTSAPTGSLSMLAKIGKHHGTSGGVEPVFALWFTRRKKINPNEKNVRVDFTDNLGDKWQEFKVFHAGYKEWAEANDLKGDISLYEKDSPYYNATSQDIDSIKRVKIQSVIQKYITHSISSTVNLPKSASIGDISYIYLEAWKQKLKGITVYRDTSRSGVLITNKTEETKVIDKNNAPKRPKKLPCTIHNTKVKGEQWVVLVGYLDDSPFEVFTFRNGKMKYKTGILIKHGKGKYDLVVNNKVLITNISKSHSTDEEEALTRLISLSLRHGVDIKFVVEQLNKSKGSVINFSKAVNRVLNKLLKEDDILKCNDCGEKSLVMQEGCLSCVNCGYSKCS